MGFPTEQTTYHRLRWDPRFDVRRVSIVIALRPSGTQRVPFLELDTDVVPWHRILEFWIDDELAWSRPQRIDRLDEIARGIAPPPPPVVTRALTALTPIGAGTAEGTDARGLRVLAWNLLFDRYEAERLKSPERWQDALDQIAAVAPDVIVLVEVTESLWRQVAAQPWVARYAAIVPPIERYGQVILSRYPVRDAGSLALIRDKRATFVTLDVGGRSVGVAAVHLTSNRKDDAPALREVQLASVLAHVNATPRDAWIIAGDFNAPPEELAVPGMTDAWLHDEPGYTFDPTRNALAGGGSGRGRRYDRIHARGLAPTTCRLLGEQLGPCGLPPSDHFGVLTDLAFVEDAGRIPPSLRTALVVMPPVALWGPLQRVRCADDRNWSKWPPHVTLFHPFIEPHWLDAAVRIVEDVARAHAPFELELDRVETLDARGQLVVLEPSRHSARSLAALHAAIGARLPSILEARPFRPHLTLGRTGRRVDVTTEWDVDRLVVLERQEAGYRAVREIALGRRDSRHVVVPDVVEPPVVARVRAAVPTARVETFGSSVYAPAHAADVDVLVAGGSGDLSTLGLTPAGDGRWRGRVDGVRLDVTLADEPRILAAAADARYLRDHLDAHGRSEAFHLAWPELRRFTRARGLLHNGLGYFSSFGWALLLAVPLCHDPVLCTVPPHGAFAAWLAWAGTLKLHARVGFDGIDQTAREPLYLPTPTAPSRNVARNVTPGTARTILGELRRASRADLVDDPPPGTTIHVTFDDEPERGRYEGKALALVRELEAEIGSVRVWGRFDGLVHRFTVPDALADRARAVIAAWFSRNDR